MSGENITPGSDAQAPVSQPAAQPAPQAPAVAPAPAPSQPAPATNNPTGDGQNPQNSGQPTAEQLYALPDGRQVDAATLAKEWKENFLPDYTRKSQILAGQQPQPQAQPQQPQQVINNPQQQTPVWQDPNWQPQDYPEILKAAVQYMKYEQQQEAQQQQQYAQQVNQFVDAQIAEIKQLEPNLSEELLFQHANKYGFSDLKMAYQNMKDTNLAVQRIQQQTVQNLQNRANDPVAVKSGQQAPVNGIDYRAVQDRSVSAIDMLRKIQGK